MRVDVCVVQESPVFFDKESTLEKIEQIAHRHQGAQLLVFPESFIPGYPRGCSFGTVVGSRSQTGKELFRLYHEQSIDLESDDKERLEKLAAACDTYLIIGITEKTQAHHSLYCSMVYISPTAGLLGVHRKIKPTGQERVIWAEAGAEHLVTFDTDIGRLGGLICWENYMPLARMAMYEKGVQMYIAPTADARDSWVPTMRHIALEGRCFVLGCNQYFESSMLPESLERHLVSDNAADCRGGSLIVSPTGNILAGPAYDRPTVLQATLDHNALAESKFDFDVCGHYQRDDIFSYSINGQPETYVERGGQRQTTG